MLTIARFVSAFIVLVLGGAASAGEIDLHGQPTKGPWTGLDVQDSSEGPEFTFVVLGDRTGGERPGVFEKGVEKTNLLKPAFAMCVGDLIDGGNRKYARGLSTNGQRDELDAILSGLNMPFFMVAGNHDIPDLKTGETYRNRYGRAYYWFTYKDVLFIVLNTEDPPATKVSDEQLAVVAEALKATPKARWTFLFMHKPLFAANDKGEVHPAWTKIEKLLGGRKATAFAGHWHTYGEHEVNGRTHYRLATTGGISELKADNEFDHLMVVTMGADGPTIVSRKLDEIPGEDLAARAKIAKRRAFIGKTSVVVAPVLMDKNVHTDEVLTAVVRNASDSPATVKVAFPKQPAVFFEPATMTVQLKPNSSAEFPVRPVAKIKGKLLADEHLAAIPYEWSVTYPGAADGKDLTVRDAGVTSFVQTRPLVRAQAAPKIDGKLDDWGKLAFAVDTPAAIGHDPAAHHGEKDGRFRFDVRYDDDALYLAVRVFDDEAVLDAEKTPWQQDGVEIRVCALPAKEQAIQAKGGEFTNVLPLLISPADKAGDKPIVYKPEKLPEGVRLAAERVDDGFIVEASVPAAYLDKAQGKPWTFVRVNVAVDDYDADGGAQLWWMPDWRSSETRTGSGMFTK